MARSTYAVAKELKKNNQPEKNQTNNKKGNSASKQTAFTVWRLSGVFKKTVKTLYKPGGRKTPAAQVLQKGQGLTLLDRSAG